MNDLKEKWRRTIDALALMESKKDPIRSEITILNNKIASMEAEKYALRQRMKAIDTMKQPLDAELRQLRIEMRVNQTTTNGTSVMTSRRAEKEARVVEMIKTRAIPGLPLNTSIGATVILLDGVSPAYVKQVITKFDGEHWHIRDGRLFLDPA